MSRRNNQDSYWISFSDIMTGLMVIFMFIAINYIVQIIEHKFVEQDIYNALQINLKTELKEEREKIANSFEELLKYWISMICPQFNQQAKVYGRYYE